MALTPPSFAKDAVATTSGWRHPKTNELLKAQKMTEAQIAEYNGATTEPVTLTEAPTTASEFADEHMEDDDEDVDLSDMTKIELEAIGREHGVELDRREKKSTLVGKVKSLID